tara:strand:+ start:529 stop:756 length:228 start_codon:yes stop_codon:yes gene_type:complete
MSAKYPLTVLLSQWSQGDGEAIKEGHGEPWSLSYPTGDTIGFYGSKKEMLAHAQRIFKIAGSEDNFINGGSNDDQ